MHELNNKWRGKNRSTNVLSFPMQSPDEVDLKILGDLVMCADVINTEARQQHKPAQAHWAHMVVHGMLHLQGYDHIDEHQADEMEALEIRMLDQLGFDNPYLENVSEETAE
jgi:probable rRNA maturation factor